MLSLIDRLHELPVDAKGKTFERLASWYLENAPEYRGVVRRVFRWNEWPGRWGPDAGIDLVAETNAGELWAVQAKAYATANTIKKADVDSFLAESARSAFSWRLLIATTDRLSPNAARTIHQQEKPVGVKLLSQLLIEDIAWPDSLDLLKPVEPHRRRPRPHQVEAVAAVTNGYMEVDRGQLLMACGTGKTLTALWVDEALGSVRTLVLLPSLSLLGQTLRVWTADAQAEFTYLAVCSDETVLADNFTSYTSDLGVPVTTDVEHVADFLSRETGRRVVFATYHSSPVIAAAQARPGVPAFDLAIADEAHRCTGDSSGPFATVLSNSKVRARRRLFMTATPRFVSSRLKQTAAERDLEVASMDDEEKFGPVLHRLSFGEAIRRELLADYRVLVIGVDETVYAQYANASDLIRRDGEEHGDAGTLARQIGLLRAIDRFDLRRVVTFHGRVAAARSFARAIPLTAAWMPEDTRPSGTLWARHVAGTMSAGHREALLNYLRHVETGERAVLANVRCLAEGVDVPALDGIAFVDPRRSPVEIIQAVGRAIRPSVEKALGTIVIPVLVLPGQGEEEALASSAFQPVWEVVRALRAHDEVLAEQLDAARYLLGRTGRQENVPDKIILDLPRVVSPEFARAFSARLVAQTTSPWEFWFGLLERYVAREGTAAGLDRTHVEADVPLGQWTMTQRMNYRKGMWLSPDRIRRLDAVPGWSWSKHHDRWETGFELLRRFIDREGHALVPDDHNENEFPLGGWVATQRQNHSGSHRRTLTAERRARLEALSGWAWSAHDARWERSLRALTRFAAREGHVSMPNNHVEAGVRLSGWIARQRASQATGQLSAVRVKRLEAIPGWRWSGEREKDPATAREVPARQGPQTRDDA